MASMETELRRVEAGVVVRAYIHGREYKGTIADVRAQPGSGVVLLLGEAGPIILDTSKIEAFEQVVSLI